MTTNMNDLYIEISDVLQWTICDCRTLSLQSLRDLVRFKDPALANRISKAIESGDYIVGDKNKKKRFR